MKRTVEISLTHEELQLIEGAITDILPRIKRHHPELRTGDEDDLYEVYEKLVKIHSELYKEEE